MKTFKKTILFVGLAGILPMLTQCDFLGGLSSSSDNAASSDESDIEAATTNAIEAVFDSVSSSSTSYAASGSTSSTTASSTRSLYGNDHRRFHCSDSSAATESFACYNSADEDEGIEAGTMTRNVTFEDCEVNRWNRDFTVNGTSNHTITYGGDGFCDVDRINFAEMTMGRDIEGDDDTTTHYDAIATHEDNLVKTWTDNLGNAVEATITRDVEVTFTNPLDEDQDEVPEQVTKNINTKDINVVRTITIDDGSEIEVHNVDVLVSDETLNVIDEDGLEATVELSKPVHQLYFDDNGNLEQVIVQPGGSTLAYHNLANLLVIHTVGEDGLTFDMTDDVCGPQEGFSTIVVYEIGDDGSLTWAGDGDITFTDGDVDRSIYDGVEINLQPRACH